MLRRTLRILRIFRNPGTKYEYQLPFCLKAHTCAACCAARKVLCACAAAAAGLLLLAWLPPLLHAAGPTPESGHWVKVEMKALRKTLK